MREIFEANGGQLKDSLLPDGKLIPDSGIIRPVTPRSKKTVDGVVYEIYTAENRASAIAWQRRPLKHSVITRIPGSTRNMQKRWTVTAPRNMIRLWTCLESSAITGIHRRWLLNRRPISMTARNTRGGLFFLTKITGSTQIFLLSIPNFLTTIVTIDTVNTNFDSTQDFRPLHHHSIRTMICCEDFWRIF